VLAGKNPVRAGDGLHQRVIPHRLSENCCRRNPHVKFLESPLARIATASDKATNLQVQKLHPRSFPPKNYICVGNIRFRFSPVPSISFFTRAIKR
jgi:hypothetical protein